MRTKRLVAFAILIVTLLCGGAIVRNAYALPTVSVGTSIDLGGGVFVLPIEVQDAVELISWQFDLSFNPNAVQIDEACLGGVDLYCDSFTGPVTEGSFFLDTAQIPTLFVPGFIVNLDGQLFGVHGAWQDPPPGPSGNGVLAYIRFTTLDEEKDPEFSLENLSTASSAAVPEPAALLLMGSGLLMLGAGRRFRRLRRTIR